MARLLSQNGAMSKREILEAWRDCDYCGRPMAESTFYDNRRYIAERLGLKIVNEHGKYSIKNLVSISDPILTQLLERGESESPAQSAADVVLIWCKQIMECMEQRFRLRLQYASTHRSPYVTDFEPYCVRTIRNFIYTVGYSSLHREVRIFALDRVLSIIVLPSTYKIPKDFNGDAYFRESFGAYAGKHISCERIVVQTHPRLGEYFRTRPLHDSQRALTRDELPADACPCDHSQLVEMADFCRVHSAAPIPQEPQTDSCFFEISVGITRDLIAELLSYGPELKVLLPHRLSAYLQELHRQAAR